MLVKVLHEKPTIRSSNSRIVHKIIKTLVPQSFLDIGKARLDTLLVINYQTQGLDAGISQVGDGTRLASCGEHAQSITVEFACKRVANTAG